MLKKHTDLKKRYCFNFSEKIVYYLFFVIWILKKQSCFVVLFSSNSLKMSVLFDMNSEKCVVLFGNNSGSLSIVLIWNWYNSLKISVLFDINSEKSVMLFGNNSLKMSVLFDMNCRKSLYCYLEITLWKCQYCLIWNLKKCVVLFSSTCLKMPMYDMNSQKSVKYITVTLWKCT